jgi:predicted ATP-grasp superfamily ATP-dependent carboligase
MVKAIMPRREVKEESQTIYSYFKEAKINLVLCCNAPHNIKSLEENFQLLSNYVIWSFYTT